MYVCVCWLLVCTTVVFSNVHARTYTPWKKIIKKHDTYVLLLLRIECVCSCAWIVLRQRACYVLWRCRQRITCTIRILCIVRTKGLNALELFCFSLLTIITTSRWLYLKLLLYKYNKYTYILYSFKYSPLFVYTAPKLYGSL